VAVTSPGKTVGNRHTRSPARILTRKRRDSTELPPTTNDFQTWVKYMVKSKPAT
jgi:hypothetical protein